MYVPFKRHAGEIPSSLGQLGNLQHLHLGENQLSGESLKVINVCESRNNVRTTEKNANSGPVDVLWNDISRSCVGGNGCSSGERCDVIRCTSLSNTVQATSHLRLESLGHYRLPSSPPISSVVSLRRTDVCGRRSIVRTIENTADFSPVDVSWNCIPSMCRRDAS